MPQRSRLEDSKRWRAVGRLEAGQTITEVARFFDVHHSVISRLWRQFQTTETVIRRPVPGRPRVTTPIDDRYIGLLARRQRRATAPSLRSDLIASTGRQISVSTVVRRLHKTGLYARRPAVCVPLTARHRQARLEWCRHHVGWTRDQWSDVLFTDESRFSLQSDSRRVLVWREVGTRYKAHNIIERSAFGGGGLTVWAGFSLGGRTDLHVYDGGTVTGQRYRDEILEPYVKPYAGAVGQDFILMDDNARPHRARLVDRFLEDEGIERMDWPAYSPDLNPIEHLWDALGRRVVGLLPPPQTLRELKKALIRQWQLLPSNSLEFLIEGMGRRCQACMIARGGHIPY